MLWWRRAFASSYDLTSANHFPPGVSNSRGLGRNYPSYDTEYFEFEKRSVIFGGNITVDITGPIVAALPVVLLVFLMTKRRAMSAARGLPLAALVIYITRLVYFGSDPNFIHAALDGIYHSKTRIPSHSSPIQTPHQQFRRPSNLGHVV